MLWLIAILTVGLLLLVLKLALARSNGPRRRHPSERQPSPTEIVLSIFAVSNLLISPAANLVDWRLIVVLMITIILALSASPRCGADLITAAGVLASIADLALHGLHTAMLITVIALLAGALFGETRLLIGSPRTFGRWTARRRS